MSEVVKENCALREEVKLLKMQNAIVKNTMNDLESRQEK